MAKYSGGQRKKFATVAGDRFPIGDKEHARLAKQMLPKAKGLSPNQKTKIVAKADSFLKPGAGRTK
jgi:hypothetical protein